MQFDGQGPMACQVIDLKPTYKVKMTLTFDPKINRIINLPKPITYKV
jgi:hypothetical protein